MYETLTYGGSGAEYLAIDTALQLWKNLAEQIKETELTELRQKLSDVGLSQEGAQDDLIIRLLVHYDMEKAAAAVKVKNSTSNESTTVKY